MTSENLTKECKYSRYCGACTSLDIPYERQLKIKKNTVVKAFLQENIGAEVLETVGMYYPYAYRNKIHLAIRRGGARNELIKIGFFEEDSDRVIDVSYCLLHDKWAETLIKIVRAYAESYSLEPYDKENGAGTLRYVAARFSDNTLLVTLVVSNQNFPGKAEFYGELKKEFKNVGLYLNINKRTDNAVFDKTFIHKYGEKYIEGSLCGVKFLLHPASFFQINSTVAAKIYKKALDIALDGSLTLSGKRVLDLYSGIGITSVLFAKAGAEVVAVESVKQATTAAAEIAKLNNVGNKITIINDSCENAFRIDTNAGQLQSEEALLKSKPSNAAPQPKKLPVRSACDIVFLDPARVGSSETVLNAILDLKPEKIIYLSCNSVSLARDLKILQSNYKIVFVQPYDMFPHTDSVEVLCCLVKK